MNFITVHFRHNSRERTTRDNDHGLYKLKTSEQSDKIILRKINEQQNKFKAIENDYNLVS